MEFKKFENISRNDLGKKFTMQGKVEVIRQTSGPTLMVLNDGTANFTFKAFVKPGVRAFPEIDVQDNVIVEAEIKKRNEDIEGEVISMKKLSNQEEKVFEENLEKLNIEKYTPEVTSFSIESEVLESLKDRFIQIATVIRRAVVERRPILIRHNADCDGYSSAITLERAILAFMDEVSGGDLNLQYQNYRRAPSKAPFYEYEDSVKDLTMWLRDKIKNGAKAPLIIITDNGSTEEDLLSIKQMKVYDCPIVVVDHHYPGEVIEGKVEVDKYIDAHINPYLTGHDSNVSAGMLGYELARFVYKENNNSVFIPAMAAILDHCDCVEREQYIKLAKDEGFTEEYLETLGEIIDMQSHYLRFMEAREFINELFGSNMNLQKNLVKMLGEELKKRYSKVEKIAKHYSLKKDFGNFYLIHFDGEKGTSRGEYPAIGKSTNHIHRVFESELDKPIITVTTGSTFMTIRVSDGISNFSVPEFCSIIGETHPHTGAEGGGHEHAGSVKFVEYGKEEVINEFFSYVESVSKKN